MAEQEEADACGMWLYKVGVPRFALVLQLEPFSEGKLQLPEEFSEEHGAELAKEVLLKLPNGAEWQVSVVRSGRKKIWFVKGWKEFAEFYSLKPTHFMLFEFTSHNRLNVMIFDTTATEIDYSNKKAKVKVESECDIAPDEAAQRPPPSSPSARAKPLKLRRKSVMGRTASGKRGRRFKDERRSFTHPRTANNRAIGALAKANVVFESENPFFMTVIQKTHLIPGHKLNVPINFFKTHFSEERGNILLQLPNVGLWNVEYFFIEYSYEKRAVFEGKSWGSFARDNSLRVGDVCAFELVEGGNEPRLNVTIFRASQDVTEPTTNAKPSKNTTSPQTKSGSTSTSRRHGHCHGNTGDQRTRSTEAALEAANAFNSNQPFFKTVVTFSSLKLRQVAIPMPFWKHMKKGTRKMELRVGSQVWEVSVNRYEANEEKRRGARMFIKGGWGEFLEGNCLVEGDVCVFELIKDEQEDADADDAGLETTVASVHVFRG
ncbi:B3 domain-containing transcription factor VRN1 [Linum perenne]